MPESVFVILSFPSRILLETRYSQDEIDLPDQQDQPSPSHDPYIGPCEGRTDRLGLPRDVDRPIVRLSFKIGELRFKPRS